MTVQATRETLSQYLPEGESPSEAARSDAPPPNRQHHHDIVVIGGSAGGVEALMTLVPEIPKDIPAALFSVQHFPQDMQSRLPMLLDRVAKIRVRAAQDGQPIEYGTLTVAPTGQHMTIQEGRVRLSSGPHENGFRPAIDPLFRSAAVTYGSRVVGVLLSGLQDDGTSGMHAIARLGGSVILQDPETAPYPDMPANALRLVDPDRIADLDGIPRAIADLVAEPSLPPEKLSPPPEQLVHEVQIAESGLSSRSRQDRMGEPTGFSCPECAGPLWQVGEEGNPRYRCHTGHAHTEMSLADSLGASTERSLYAALRALEERVDLNTRAARRQEEAGRPALAARFRRKVVEDTAYIPQLREFILQQTRTAEADTSIPAGDEMPREPSPEAGSA